MEESENWEAGAELREEAFGATSRTSPSPWHLITVVGYGNELRGDDAAGPRVAEIVGSWRLRDVRTLTRHQLTPELAAVLANSRSVIFIDARHDLGDTGGVHMRPVEPGRHHSDTVGAHVSDPAALLELTRAVYARAPEAWWITIPAVNFAFGARLSTVTRSGIEVALQLIRHQIAALQRTRDRLEGA